MPRSLTLWRLKVSSKCSSNINNVVSQASLPLTLARETIARVCACRSLFQTINTCLIPAGILAL